MGKGSGTKIPPPKSRCEYFPHYDRFGIVKQKALFAYANRAFCFYSQLLVNTLTRTGLQSLIFLSFLSLLSW